MHTKCGQVEFSCRLTGLSARDLDFLQHHRFFAASQQQVSWRKVKDDAAKASTTTCAQTAASGIRKAGASARPSCAGSCFSVKAFLFKATELCGGGLKLKLNFGNWNY